MTIKTSKIKDLKVLSRNIDFCETAKRALQPEPIIPDIGTFSESEDYLGLKLYPRQLTLLRLMFLEVENFTAYDVKTIDEWSQGLRSGPTYVGINPDIWDRIDYLKSSNYPHFNEVINITGRRGSKNLIGAISWAYKQWKLIQSDDPARRYGIKAGEHIYSTVSATSFTQAKIHQFADYVSVVQHARCFEPYISAIKDHYISFYTPSDIRELASVVNRGIPIDREFASLVSMPISSNSSAGRGGATITVTFDEFAHMIIGSGGPRTSENLYNAVYPTMDQFREDKLLYIPTSPYTKVGMAYKLYTSGLMETSDEWQPNMLVVQLPSWNLYEDAFNEKVLKNGNNPYVNGHKIFFTVPQLYDDEAKRMEKRDPKAFKVERMAQWAAVLEGALPEEHVDNIFLPFFDGEKTRVLEEQPKGVRKWIYYAHADPASSHDNFALVIAHSEPIPDEDGEVWDHVIVDKIKVWKPEDYDGYQIDYPLVEAEITQELSAFPAVRRMSYDQYGGFITVSSLQKKLNSMKLKIPVDEETFTAKSNRRRSNILRGAIGQGWVKSYKDDFGLDNTSQLENELKFLQNHNGQFKAPTYGPVQEDDAADCLSVVVEKLVGDQYERLRRREEMGEHRIQTAPSEVPTTGRRQRLSQFYTPQVGAVRNRR